MARRGQDRIAQEGSRQEAPMGDRMRLRRIATKGPGTQRGDPGEHLEEGLLLGRVVTDGDELRSTGASERMRRLFREPEKEPKSATQMERSRARDAGHGVGDSDENSMRSKHATRRPQTQKSETGERAARARARTVPLVSGTPDRILPPVPSTYTVPFCGWNEHVSLVPT